MAHRKPLGTTFTSTFDWDGSHPQLGDYLVSMADTWYLVVGVQEKANPKKIGLTCERIAPVPAERQFALANGRTPGEDSVWGVIDGEIAVAWRFHWYERKKRAA